MRDGWPNGALASVESAIGNTVSAVPGDGVNEAMMLVTPVVSMGDFEPLWLDPQARCLYAALHRAESAHATTGVVLVPPLLHEMAISRRLLTQVAAGLAAQGLPSLRFDFFGTGDSSGGGDQLDFASMFIDLDLAVATLTAQSGVERVVLLAWRAAALPVAVWLERGGRADMVVLWEPITEGSAWLVELERDDANERAERFGARPGVSCTTDQADGQLMGFAASPRLRLDMAQARLDRDWLPDTALAWAVMRADSSDLPMRGTQTLPLPDGAPSFNGGASMDTMFFLTPPVRNLVDDLGQALRGQPWR